MDLMKFVNNAIKILSPFVVALFVYYLNGIQTAGKETNERLQRLEINQAVVQERVANLTKELERSNNIR